MPIRHSLWRVATPPTRLSEGALPSEQILEEMVVASPEILSEQWMIVGRQVDTVFGGRIDLLAIEPDGSLVLIELKRGRTPRDVVAQAIDYASWLENIGQAELESIYVRFAPNHELSADFQTRFSQPLEEVSINERHQIVIAAAELDLSSERIVGYLNRRGILINVICFQIFDNGVDRLLSRSWLLDPAETQLVAVTVGSARTTDSWNREYYVSFGHGLGRSWEDAVKYGFVSAGGGAWYSNTLKLLKTGDRIWVKAPGHGFVGVGIVKGPAEPAPDFRIKAAGGTNQPALDVLTSATYHREFANDPEKVEYFVPVEWAETVPLNAAVNETGLFGNQNTVCAPKTPKGRHTIERLKQAFPRYDGIRTERAEQVK